MTSVDPTRIDINTDPTTRRMKGVALHGNTPFDVPFITQVADNLWQGGCAEGLILPRFIKHVVSLYPWERYTYRHDLDTELYVRMYDSTDQGVDQIDDLALWVNACRETGNVLLHCQAGLNRSSLVAARAIHLDTGMEGAVLVDHLRSLRSPAALCNPAFEAEVRSWA